jgi:hypothetical protein
MSLIGNLLALITLSSPGKKLINKVPFYKTVRYEWIGPDKPNYRTGVKVSYTVESAIFAVP